MTETKFDRKKGAVMMLASSFCFSSMQIAIRMTGDTIPLMEQIFFRNIVCLIVCLIIILKTNGSLFGDRKDQPLLFVRSSFGFVGFICMFYAAANAHQADVTTLMKLSPFLITLWAALFLKEKIAKIQVPALIIAFGGSIFIANPTFNSNLFPLLMAFLCALATSVSYTMLAYFKDKVDGMTIIMHFSTFSCLCTVPFMCFNFVMPSGNDIFLLFLIGAFGALGQIFLTYCYRLSPASEVSIYNYSGIIFSIILGFICLGEVLPWTSWVGCGLVIVAGALAFKFSR